MNAKIKWDDRQGLPGFGWLGTPLGQSMAERQRIASLTPFAFAAPLVQRRSKVQWLGEDVTNTLAYAMCMQKLGEKCKDLPISEDKGGVFINPYGLCMQGVDSACKLQAAAGTGKILSSKEVTALQNQINSVLAKEKICSITPDGDLGPTTCHAATYVQGNLDASIPVPAECGAILAKSSSSGFNPDCKVGAGGGPPPPCTEANPCPADKDCFKGKCVEKCSTGFKRSDDGSCVAISTKPASSETPWGLFVLGAAALGAIGLVFLKAPKLPPREAERPEDNPWVGKVHQSKTAARMGHKRKRRRKKAA